jgi:hypothetical protein
MLPTLRAGQRVAVDLAPVALERGDLLLFRQVDYLVVHRLLGPASREDGTPQLRTRGDGLAGLDPPVDRRRVRGKVVAIEDDGQWWILEGAGSRVWSLAVALHDLAWAAAGTAAGRIDKLLGAVRLRSWTASADRVLLALAHRLFFRILHRRTSQRPSGFYAPPDTAGESSVRR